MTLVTDSLEAHVSVLQQVDKKPPTWTYLLNLPNVSPIHLIQKRPPPSSGSTKSITEGGTNVLGKSLEVSLSTTKTAVNKGMIDTTSRPLSDVNMLPIHGEYKLWFYRNYTVSLLQFHLSVNAVTKCAFIKLENLATRYLKKWLGLPRSAIQFILYYPGVCYSSIWRNWVSYLVSVQLGIPSSSSWAYSNIWGMNTYRPRLQIITFCLKSIHSYQHFPWLFLFTNCLRSC